MGELKWGLPVNSEHKRATILTLMDHLQDFFEPSTSTGQINASTMRADGSGWDGPSMSPLARHHSVVELIRCLELCRRMAPGHYRHLIGFYRSEWRTVDRAVKKRNAHGKLIDDVGRVRERVVPGWVMRRMVDRAMDFVCGVYNGEPELPRAFTRKLRALADSDGWTEAA